MKVPLTVPTKQKKKYTKNFAQLTYEDPYERIFIFAADQRLEHLYDDFHGPEVPVEATRPEHIFEISSKAPISALATHFGLISRYGMDFKDIPYIVKVNGKSNLIGTTDQDPISSTLFSLETIINSSQSINIVGLGYTIYLGSIYESSMLQEAAKVVQVAHENGLIATLWIYPRGNYINREKQQYLSAGATGVGLSLGADFVKIMPPPSFAELTLAVQNSGNTGVICAGGISQDSKQLLKTLDKQINAGARGCAIGRNIFQKTKRDAITFCQQIYNILYS
ncbi:aldolase [Candidatus Dependentiae bacterium]|nr:MAG: aldolase [Candidatus Dependentiae bacterium]